MNITFISQDSDNSVIVARYDDRDWFLVWYRYIFKI